MNKILLLFICIVVFQPVFSQTPIEHNMKYYVGEDGKLYWNRYLPFYLTISPTIGSEGILLKSKITEEYTNPAYWDSEGVHYVRHDFAVSQETKKIIVPNIEIKFEVYADGINPVTTSEFLTAQKTTQNKVVYYGPNLEVAIKSTDNLSGVEKTYYSINKENWIEYNNNLKFATEGTFNLQYYSSDNVGNAEVYNSKDFVIDLTPPSTYYTIVGISIPDNVLSMGTLVTLASEDKLSGVTKIYYKIDDKADVLYTGGNLPISTLSNGEHKLTYWSVDNVGNKETAQIFDFYLDKLAPILTSDVLGDRYIVNDQVYFSGRTKMKLTAVDNKSGIKDVLYSIDGSDFESYDNPFYLPSVLGIHVVRYYAIDNVENNTSSKTSVNYRLDNYKYNVNKIYVDLIGPTLDFNYVGDYFKARDTTFINSKTKIKMTAVDAESGIQYLSYSLDGVLEETKYTEPFSIDGQGFHTLEYFGYDNVNNRNKDDLFFVVDNEAPELKYNFSIEPIGTENGIDKYPSYVILYLAATDQKVGTKEIYYSLNGATELKFSKMIEGFKPKTEYKIKVRTVDKLNNEQTNEIKFMIE